MLRILKTVCAVSAALLCCALVPVFLLVLTMSGSGIRQSEPDILPDAAIMDAYKESVSGASSDALAAARSVRKHFWIPGGTALCPKPDPACYGETDDPKTLSWLLEDARELLDGQDTLFSTDVEILRGSKVTYYLDETILAVTWKQVFDDFVYTISEVKISDPSQFRRKLAGDQYDYRYHYTTSAMASESNAVVASGGDFYRNRQFGIIVYDGEVKRVDRTDVTETCFVTRSGELIFSHCGELNDVEQAQKFVDENDIGFSLAFGPILIENGERCEAKNYALGEANQFYPRAALCERDTLHYLLVTANSEAGHRSYQNIHTFAKNIATFGCKQAYTLDGGQTAVIVMDGKPLNKVQFGEERPNSDMIYFATALPERDPQPQEDPE